MADGNTYTRPGVYIQELPGVPTVQSASTSVPVFIGITENLAPSDLNVARQVTGWADYQNRYGSFVFGANVSAAVYEFFAEGGAVCYVIGIAPGSQDKKMQLPISDPAAKFTFNAACIGDWAGKIYISVVNAGPISQDQHYSSYFAVNVMVKESEVVAPTAPTIWTRLLNSYITSNSISPVAIGGSSPVNYYILESFGAFSAASVVIPPNGVCPLQAQINAKSFFIRVSVAASTGGTSRAGTPTVLAGSTSTLPLAVTAYKQALDALASIPDASLIATPDAAAVDITKNTTDGGKFTDVALQVTQKCAALPAFFYVIDAPYLDASASDDTNLMTLVMGGGSNPLGSEYTAIYYPWPIVLNPISGKSVPVPPSGAVLGRYATTDQIAGVHVSPAGVRTGGIKTAVSMTRWVTENAQSLLNPHGINVIRSIPGYGVTIYGARTLGGPGDWQYVAVRRFVTFVEQSLKMSLEWVVFQPNGEILWGTVVREVTAFLNQLWRQGALFGSTAAEAFFVTCDNTNNDATTRAQGVLNVDVGLAVLYPAEFVVIRIAQMTTGSA